MKKKNLVSQKTIILKVLSIYIELVCWTKWSNRNLLSRFHFKRSYTNAILFLSFLYAAHLPELISKVLYSIFCIQLADVDWYIDFFFFHFFTIFNEYTHFCIYWINLKICFSNYMWCLDDQISISLIIMCVCAFIIKC